jgi:crossover junction endodeoxyribonuclease RuvC
MRVAEARGIIIYEALKKNIPVFEYAPMEIKMAITSNGKSDKSQMMKMLPMLIDIPKKKASKGQGSDIDKVLDDEYDAIAVALTHAAIIHS